MSTAPPSRTPASKTRQLLEFGWLPTMVGAGDHDCLCLLANSATEA